MTNTGGSLGAVAGVDGTALAETVSLFAEVAIRMDAP
jgi:hypothetical protein